MRTMDSIGDYKETKHLKIDNIKLLSTVILKLLYFILSYFQEINDGESTYYSNRAKCYQAIGDLDKALKDAEIACQLD